MCCPAEIVIDRLRFGGYIWSICQPDAQWGEWERSAISYSEYEDAARDAKAALRRVHIQQGYEPYEKPY